MNIEFNSALIKEEMNNITKEKKELEKILDNIKGQINNLKDNWDSATSEEVYYHFEDYKEYFQNLIDAFDNDIKFLDNAIKNYEAMDYNANKEIDDKIAE